MYLVLWTLDPLRKWTLNLPGYQIILVLLLKLGQAHHASRSLLDSQHLRPHPTPTESESDFQQIPKLFACALNFGSSGLRDF